MKRAMPGIFRLYEHTVIGIDFDGTLIGHPRSDRLQDFVAAEHPRRDLWIITHRTACASCGLWSDLYHGTCPRLTPAMFKGVAHLPLPLYDAYCDCQQRRSPETLAGDVSEAERGFLHWKAEKARELGCTVLIDDLSSVNSSGCAASGLEFLSMARL